MSPRGENGMKVEFERVNVDYGTGYSIFGGIKGKTEEHREIIARRAREG